MKLVVVGKGNGKTALRRGRVARREGAIAPYEERGFPHERPEIEDRLR